MSLLLSIVFSKNSSDFFDNDNDNDYSVYSDDIDNDSNDNDNNANTDDDDNVSQVGRCRGEFCMKWETP